MTATRARAQGPVLLVAGLLALGAGAVLWAWLGWAAALGYLGGVATGAGMLAALVLCVSRLVAPAAERRGPRWPYLLLHLGKFAAAVALAWVLVVVLRASLAAFAGGYLTALIAFVAYFGGGSRAIGRTT